MPVWLGLNKQAKFAESMAGVRTYITHMQHAKCSHCISHFMMTGIICNHGKGSDVLCDARFHIAAQGTSAFPVVYEGLHLLKELYVTFKH